MTTQRTLQALIYDILPPTHTPNLAFLLTDTANAVEGARKIVQLKQRLYNYDLRASTSEIASKVSCCQCSPSVKVCEKSEYKRLMQQNSVLLIVQELCESRGGRPGLSVLTSLLISVDVKNY